MGRNDTPNFYPRRKAKRKYPPLPCKYCGSLRTWRKRKTSVYCQDCHRYSTPHPVQFINRTNEGNSKWLALRYDNSIYNEEWEEPSNPAEQRALLDMCDRLNREEHARHCKQMGIGL